MSFEPQRRGYQSFIVASAYQIFVLCLSFCWRYFLHKTEKIKCLHNYKYFDVDVITLNFMVTIYVQFMNLYKGILIYDPFYVIIYNFLIEQSMYRNEKAQLCHRLMWASTVYLPSGFIALSLKKHLKNQIREDKEKACYMWPDA